MLVQTRRRLLMGLALAGAGLLLTLMTVATSSQPPSDLKFPMRQFTIPSFCSGKLSANQGSMLIAAESVPGHIGYAFNLGELLGLHGLPSLLPLLAIWLLAVVASQRLNQTHQKPPA